MNAASASITDKPTALSRLLTVNPRLQPWATPPDSNGFIDAAHRINAPMRSLHKADDAYAKSPTAEAAGYLTAAAMRLENHIAQVQ